MVSWQDKNGKATMLATNQVGGRGGQGGKEGKGVWSETNVLGLRKEQNVVIFIRTNQSTKNVGLVLSKALHVQITNSEAYTH